MTLFFQETICQTIRSMQNLNLVYVLEENVSISHRWFMNTREGGVSMSNDLSKSWLQDQETVKEGATEQDLYPSGERGSMYSYYCRISVPELFWRSWSDYKNIWALWNGAWLAKNMHYTLSKQFSGWSMYQSVCNSIYFLSLIRVHLAVVVVDWVYINNDHVSRPVRQVRKVDHEQQSVSRDARPIDSIRTCQFIWRSFTFLFCHVQAQHSHSVPKNIH